MITPDQLTFRRLQTDDHNNVTVFASIDGVLADGSPASSPWKSVTKALTADQKAVADALVAQALQDICDTLNDSTPV